MEKLSYSQLAPIIDEITEKVTQEIISANRFGNLEEVLNKYNYQISHKEVESAYYSTNAKILILGELNSKINDIENTFKKYGISKDRIEIITDYEKLTNFNPEKLRNTMRYSDILVCAMPHKMKNIGNYPDLISMIEHNQEEYPLLNRVTDERGELKFTINGLRNAIEKTHMYNDLIE